MGTSASSWFLSQAVFEAVNDAVGNQKSMLALIRALKLASNLKHYLYEILGRKSHGQCGRANSMGVESMDD